MAEGATVFVGIAVPGPNYPQRTTPVEVRLFSDRGAADEWVSSYYTFSRAGNAPVPHVYERKVDASA